MLSDHRHWSIVKTLCWSDEAATAGFASDLAAQDFVHNACIALDGPLGSGKTTLVRYLLRALGVQGRIKSPTYAVVEPYSLPALDIWHFDCYRFAHPREWDDAGFRDVVAQRGLKLIEWPDKAGPFLPTCTLWLTLSVRPDQAREVTVRAGPGAASDWLRRL